MKKLLTLGSILALLAPTLASAAYNSVSLGSGAIINSNSVNANVSGPTAAVASLSVTAGNFTVTLNDGSSFQVSAPNKNKLTKDTSEGLVSSICNDSESSLYYITNTTVSLTITPSGAICANPSGGGGQIVGTNVVASSGGGGSSTVQATTTAPAIPIVITAFNQVEAVAQIKAQLIVLIQKLIAQLIAQLQAEIVQMQASGNY